MKAETKLSVTIEMSRSFWTTSGFEGWVFSRKQHSRVLETAVCEGLEVKFRKYTITALFRVTRHGQSVIFRRISVPPASVCVRATVW